MEIRLYVSSYRITMADNIFSKVKVGTRDDLRSSNRREAIEFSVMLPDGENMFNKGMNTDSTVLDNSLEERAVRTSFCPNTRLKTDFPRAIWLPDCIITERSLSFFKYYPTLLGKMSGMHRSFLEEMKRRTAEDDTKECDDHDIQLYMMFLRKYGSHFVSGVDMGCSVTWTHTVQRSEASDILATINSMGRMEKCKLLVLTFICFLVAFN